MTEPNPLAPNETLTRTRVRCTECGCKAFSDAREARTPLTHDELLALIGAIAHLASCSRFREATAGEWRYCAPDSRP